MALEASDEYVITHDVWVGDLLAFGAGDSVIVEAVSPDPNWPTSCYVVYSESLQKRFRLTEKDLQLRENLAEPTVPKSARIAPPLKAKKRRHINYRKALVISASLIFLLAVGLGGFFFLEHANFRKSKMVAKTCYQYYQDLLAEIHDMDSTWNSISSTEAEIADTQRLMQESLAVVMNPAILSGLYEDESKAARTLRDSMNTLRKTTVAAKLKVERLDCSDKQVRYAKRLFLSGADEAISACDFALRYTGLALDAGSFDTMLYTFDKQLEFGKESSDAEAKSVQYLNSAQEQIQGFMDRNGIGSVDQL